MSSGDEDEEAGEAGPGSAAGKGGSKRPEREPIYDVDTMHGELSCVPAQICFHAVYMMSE